MKTESPFVRLLDKYLPPFAAYFEARKHPRGPWAGPVIIAQRSGLSHRTVTRIGAKISWKGIDVDVMSAFLDACGFECAQQFPFLLRNMRRRMRYCRGKAAVPSSHLTQREWMQRDKLSRLHLEAG